MTSSPDDQRPRGGSTPVDGASSGAGSPTGNTIGVNATVVVGDAVALLVFAILARIAHSSPEHPFSVGAVLNTYWPFLIGAMLGWGVCRLASTLPRPIAPGGVIVWVLTVVTGLTVWGLKHQQVPHWSFMIVASTMSALLLLGWRALANRLGK